VLEHALPVAGQQAKAAVGPAGEAKGARQGLQEEIATLNAALADKTLEVIFFAVLQRIAEQRQRSRTACGVASTTRSGK